MHRYHKLTKIHKKTCSVYRSWSTEYENRDPSLFVCRSQKKSALGMWWNIWNMKGISMWRLMNQLPSPPTKLNERTVVENTVVLSFWNGIFDIGHYRFYKTCSIFPIPIQQIPKPRDLIGAWKLRGWCILFEIWFLRFECKSSLGFWENPSWFPMEAKIPTYTSTKHLGAC